jgi:CheY-like chemotaxis protein
LTVGTVLVVDDEFGVAELINAILTDEGHRVLTAANGRQGLDAMAKEQLDLVFLDYMMPVMDGSVMLQAIVAHPELRRIPVVMMSSMPETSVAERCSGYAAFMRKPFAIGDVIDFAAKLVSNLNISVPE